MAARRHGRLMVAGRRTCAQPSRNPSGVALDAEWATTEPRWVLDDLRRLALRAPTRAEFFDEAAVRLKRVAPVRRRVLAHARPGLGPDHPAPPPGHSRPLPGPGEQRVRGRRRQQVRRAGPRRAQGRDAERRDRRSPRAKPALPRPADPGRPRPRAAQRVRRRRRDLGRADPRPPRRPARVRGARRRPAVPRLRACSRAPSAAGSSPRPPARIDAAPPRRARRRRARRGRRPDPRLVDRPSRCWPSSPAPRPRTACATRRCTSVASATRSSTGRRPAHRDGQDARRALARAPRRPLGTAARRTRSRSSSSARTRPSSRRCCSRRTA